VELRIEDDGPGIAPERIPTLFRPFQSGRPGGTGLGLALVERIVDAHGGTIRVDGRPGLGAEFRIELPAAPVEDRA
jgi:signal transduction histidine kinase